MKDYAAGKPWKKVKQQHILETAYGLFSEYGIVPVTISEVARASGVGKATVFRYFSTKQDMVYAVGTWKWGEYIGRRSSLLTGKEKEQMTGAEYLSFFLDAFLDLFRNYPDILRFNYDLNSYLRFEAGFSEIKQPFMHIVDRLDNAFHKWYEQGVEDGTLNTDYSEEKIFSSSFHIMLATATRYAIGLIYMPESETDSESELILLKELLLSRFTVNETKRSEAET